MQDLIHQVTAWAERTPEIQALLLVGSQARTVFPADEWADHDFEMFVTGLPADLTSKTWAEQFGTVWIYNYNELDANTPQPLVIYEGGAKVDFTFSPFAELEKLVLEQRLFDHQMRGYRVLIDKCALAEKLPAASLPQFSPPTAEEVLKCCDWFWFGAIYVAKQIRRRNLWVVKFRDWSMKLNLLQMLEWDAQTTWHDGHFLTKWASTEVVDELENAFAHFDPADSWEKLLTTLKLFNRVARAVAERYQISYPAPLEAEISAHIQHLYEGDTLG